MRLLLSLVLLSSPVVASADSGADADWSVRVTPYDQVFPALELSQAHRHTAARPPDHVLGEGTGLVAVHLRADNAGERIQLRVAAAGLATDTEFSATLGEAGAAYELYPPLDWDVARLLALKAPSPASLTFTLEREGRQTETRTAKVSLHPLEEALYFVRDGGDSVDLSWIFAAYVDENDAVVDRVLAAALASGIAPRLDGYSAADPNAVYAQVWAIWHALAERGIRYSSADPAIERGPHIFSQRVRFLADTWDDRSANCIDGSVLIASVLGRIGVRNFLVLVPGHAFLGFYADADAQHPAYLETTLLGAHVPMPTKPPAFAANVEPTPANRASLASFAAALAAGRAHYVRVAAKLDGRHRPDYAVIDIAAARAFGIKPIEATTQTKPEAE